MNKNYSDYMINFLLKQVKNVSRISHTKIQTPTKETTCYTIFSLAPEDIRKTINAPGWDQIEAKAVKECKYELQSVLCKVIKQSFYVTKYQKSRNLRDKSGDRENPNNYCPLSVLPILS